MATLERTALAPIPEIKPDELVLNANGQVQKFVHWVQFNGQQWPVLEISRNTNETFTAAMSTPDGGGSPVTGSLARITDAMHPDLGARCIALFEMHNPTAIELASLGFGANVAVRYI